MSEEEKIVLYDKLSCRYFASTSDFLQHAAEKLTAKLMAKGYLMLSEIYEELGLSKPLIDYIVYEL